MTGPPGGPLSGDFGEAVSRGLLTDYKVFVLGVAEKEMSAALQAQFTRDSELQIDDAAKIVGWRNGLAKRKILRAQIGVADIDDTPMRRAVAFAGTIANSKKFAERRHPVPGIGGTAGHGTPGRL